MSAADFLARACHSLGWPRAPGGACGAARDYDLAHPQGTWQPGLGGRTLLVYDLARSPLAQTLKDAGAVPIYLGSDYHVLPKDQETAPLALAPEGTLLGEYSVSFAPTTGWIPRTSRTRTVVWGATLASVMEVVDLLRGYGLSNGSDLTLSRPCHLAQFAAVPSTLLRAHTFAPSECYLCSLTGSCTHTELPWPNLDAVVSMQGANLTPEGGPLATLRRGSNAGTIGVIAPAGGDALVARAAATIQEKLAPTSSLLHPQRNPA